MKKCKICGKATSFIYEGKGNFKGKPVCPSCQAKEFGTNFNTGCGKDGKSCSLKEINDKK